MIDQVKSRFNVPLDTILQVMSDTLFPANLLASSEETETNTITATIYHNSTNVGSHKTNTEAWFHGL